MKDGIIKGDGTSRFLRGPADFLSKYPSYEAFAQAMAAGTVPADVLFNEPGWSQRPDFLNKKNLLTDATAALYGFPNTVVPDEVFSKLSTATTYKKVKSAEILYGGTVNVPAEEMKPNTEYIFKFRLKSGAVPDFYGSIYFGMLGEDIAASKEKFSTGGNPTYDTSPSFDLHFGKDSSVWMRYSRYRTVFPNGSKGNGFLIWGVSQLSNPTMYRVIGQTNFNSKEASLTFSNTTAGKQVTAILDIYEGGASL